MKLRYNLLFTLALLFGFNASQAVVGTTTPTDKDGFSVENVLENMFPADADLTAKQLKKKAKMEKRLNKFQTRRDKINAKRIKKGKAEIDFSDPVKKWMWFWILGWGLAIILGILIPIIFLSGGFGGAFLLSALIGLLGLFGTVSLVIWLIKMFA